jgi:hypothetical protein
MDTDILLNRTQAIQLMALCAMLRDGDLSFRGHGPEDEEAASDVLCDIGEEVALQLGGLA